MNRDNLALLAEYLLTIDHEKFNMSLYSMDDYEFYTVTDALEQNFCGTAACMVGHATAIFPLIEEDIIEKTSSIDGEVYYEVDFLKYSIRVFGIEYGSKWEYIFGSEWSNSIPEAIERIVHVLLGGVIPEWPYIESNIDIMENR